MALPVRDSAGRHPSVTVVVATLGTAPGLEDCLHLLDEQVRDLKDRGSTAELLVVVNCEEEGFPPDRRKKLDELATRLIFEARPGKSNALNCAIEKAQGDILAFTDDDAQPAPGWLRALIAPLRDESEGAPAGCGGPVFPVYPPGGPPRWWRHQMARRSSHFLGPYHHPGNRDRDYGWKEAAFPFGANCAYRRRVLEANRYDPTLGPNRETGLRGGEDTELAMRLRARGERIVYRHEAIVYHPVAPERMSIPYVRKGHYIQGIEEIRIRRALGGKLPSPWSLGAQLVRHWLASPFRVLRSHERRVRKRMKSDFKRGMLAELRNESDRSETR